MPNLIERWILNQELKEKNVDWFAQDGPPVKSLTCLRCQTTIGLSGAVNSQRDIDAKHEFMKQHLQCPPSRSGRPDIL